MVFKKQNYIAVFLATFLLLTGCAESDYSAEKLYWKATKQYNEVLENLSQAKSVDFQKVIIAYRQIIAKYPRWQNTPNVYFNISRLYILQKKYNQARMILESLIEKFYSNPSVSANAKFAIGLIYEEEGRWEDALAQFKIVEENYPNSYSALLVPLSIVRHYTVTGEEEKKEEAYKEAVLKYKNLIMQDPNTITSLAALDFAMTVFVEQRKEEEAIKFLSDIISDFPTSATATKAILSQALIYYKAGDIQKAVENLETIIKDFPDSKLSQMAQEQIDKIKKGAEESEF